MDNYIKEEIELMHQTSCSGKDLLAVKDALQVLNGKWKLPILISILNGNKRFKEIAKEVNGISDRMLAKELKELEINTLLERKVFQHVPLTVEYTPTAHTYSLVHVVNALKDWGYLHRKKMIG